MRVAVTHTCAPSEIWVAKASVGGRAAARQRATRCGARAASDVVRQVLDSEPVSLREGDTASRGGRARAAGRATAVHESVGDKWGLVLRVAIKVQPMVDGGGGL